MDEIKTNINIRASAMPSESEIAAWHRLPRDEQLRLLREELSHPDCKILMSADMDDVRRDGRALAAQLRNA